MRYCHRCAAQFPDEHRRCLHCRGKLSSEHPSGLSSGTANSPEPELESNPESNAASNAESNAESNAASNAAQDAQEKKDDASKALNPG